MNEKQLSALKIRHTDTEGLLQRLNGNILLFEQCLEEFLEDKTVSELNIAIANKSWDEAFTAAHALKGVAGNMGFFPLMHDTGQLIVLIRGGRLREITVTLNALNSSYRDIIDGIRQYFSLADKNK